MKKKAAKKGGRKKAEDPKEPLTIWVEKSIIKALGGKDMARGIAKTGVRLAFQNAKDADYDGN